MHFFYIGPLSYSCGQCQCDRGDGNFGICGEVAVQIAHGKPGIEALGIAGYDRATADHMVGDIGKKAQRFGGVVPFVIISMQWLARENLHYQ